MKGPARQYTREMYRKFRYFATWEPTKHLSLGDIGEMQKNEFIRISNLANFNIPFATCTDPTPGNLEYHSQGGVSITTKLAGTFPPQGSILNQADAGLSVEFAKEKAVMFKANNTRNTSIDDVISLGQTLMQLFKQGKWQRNWVVITELIDARAATILISNNRGSKLELKANANLSAPGIDIADAAFQFSPVVSRGMATTVVAQTGITPLFKVMGIKRKGILGARWGMKRIRTTLSPAPSPDLYKPDDWAFEPIDFEE